MNVDYLSTTEIDRIVSQLTPKTMTKSKRYFSSLWFGREGAGKTLTALATAYRFVRNPEKILVIETDGHPDTPYGHNPATGQGFPCHVVSTPNSKPEAWIAAFQLARQGGYEALIIDSITPFWAGTEGLFALQAKIAGGDGKYAGSSWQQINKIQDAMFEQIIAARSEFHVFLCARAQDYRQNNEIVGDRPAWRDTIGYPVDVTIEMIRYAHRDHLAVRTDAMGVLTDANAKTFPQGKNARQSTLDDVQEAFDEESKVDIIAEIKKSNLTVPKLNPDGTITTESAFTAGTRFVNPTYEIADAAIPYLQSGEEITSERERLDELTAELPTIDDREKLLGMYDAANDQFYISDNRRRARALIAARGKEITRQPALAPVDDSRPVALADD